MVYQEGEYSRPSSLMAYMCNLADSENGMSSASTAPLYRRMMFVLNLSLLKLRVEVALNGFTWRKGLPWLSMPKG